MNEFPSRNMWDEWSGSVSAGDSLAEREKLRGDPRFTGKWLGKKEAHDETQNRN
jgi:hypothetical protein